MVLKTKQKRVSSRKKGKIKKATRQRKKSPIKTLKCDNCGDKALVGMLFSFTRCTDPEFINTPGASIWFLCNACGMHTALRHLTSDEMTNMAIKAQKDGRQFCESCGWTVDKKHMEGDHPWGDCPKCGCELSG